MSRRKSFAKLLCYCGANWPHKGPCLPPYGTAKNLEATTKPVVNSPQDSTPEMRKLDPL